MYFSFAFKRSMSSFVTILNLIASFIIRDKIKLGKGGFGFPPSISFLV